MDSYSISNLKQFTTHLFLKETFDFFEIAEAVFQTFTTFTLSGKLNKEYYDNEERETITRTYCTWNQLRPFCLQIIKGKKLPISFKIVLLTGEKENQQFFANLPENLKNSISSCSLTILYKNGTLSCVTGIAYSQFVLDKSAEALWSKTIESFLKKQEIPFEKQ